MESPRGHIRAVSGSGDQPGEAGTQPPSTDPAVFVAALRDASEHESRKEELLEAKTRGVVTVAGAYFAIVQTATFTASGTLGKLEASARTWVVGLALVAIATLALAIVAAVKQHWPRKHWSLSSSQIGDDMVDLLDGKLDQREALRKLGGQYAKVTSSRQKANEGRVSQYYEAGVFSLLAVIATTAELIVALVTRI
jgi:hypothetical protein